MIGRGIGIPFRHGTGGGGTSIPPEIKKSIIAWYSPYKQKLTNYDVIEAYVEDFTDWYKEINNGTVTATNKSFHFTEVKKIGSTNAIVRLVSHRINGEIKLNIKGVTEDNPISFTEYSTPVLTVNKDGVYTLVINDATVGIYFTKVGVVDVTVTQLPTSILKDFSGNKHDAYLYGFKGKLNSGVGIYAQDFKNWNYGSAINNNISTKSYNKFHIVKKKADNRFGFTIGIPKTNYYNQSYKLKFNINKKIDDIKFSVVSTDGNLQSTLVYSVNINDGSIIDVPIVSEEVFNNKEETNIYYDFGTNKNIEIDVELIADYPNQLCYDGKSYAVAYDMPILTDYTVMAERTWFEKEEYSAFISNSLGSIEEPNNGAFCVEIKSLNSFTTSSFGSLTSIGIPEKGITYQTKQSYNGNSINVGTKESNDILILGGRYFYKNDNDAGNTWNGCHGAIIVADRSFTEEEINWLKQNWDKI